MTYYNIVFHMGHERFAAALRRRRGVGRHPARPAARGVGPWAVAADAAGVETVLLAAPTAPDERLPRICARARGFVYAVGLLGVTGERDRARRVSATIIAQRLKAVTDKPVLIGVGISNAAAGRRGVPGRRRRGHRQRRRPPGARRRRPARRRRLRRRRPRRPRRGLSAPRGSDRVADAFELGDDAQHHLVGAAADREQRGCRGRSGPSRSPPCSRCRRGTACTSRRPRGAGGRS